MNIECAFLADYVELAGNKLYMMGGGWDTLTINNPLRSHSFGVVASFRADEQEVDRPYEVAIQIVHVDSDVMLVDVHGNLEFSGLPQQSRLKSELAHFGLNFTLNFQDDGLFHLIVRIENEIRKIVPFQVVFGAGKRETTPSSR